MLRVPGSIVKYFRAKTLAVLRDYLLRVLAVFRGSVLRILPVPKASRGSILRVLLVLRVLYCSHSRHLQCLGHSTAHTPSTVCSQYLGRQCSDTRGTKCTRYREYTVLGASVDCVSSVPFCAYPCLLTDCRSKDDSIDLVAPGASTYSPVKIPSAPLQQLGGEAKVCPSPLHPIECACLTAKGWN